MLSAKESHEEPTRSGLFTVLADVETQGRGVPGEFDGNEWGRRPWPGGLWAGHPGGQAVGAYTCRRSRGVGRSGGSGNERKPFGNQVVNR